MSPEHIKPDLAHIAAKRPFPEFAQWWQMGEDFIRFMSEALISQWAKLDNANDAYQQVQGCLAEYLRLVYGREASPALVDNFARQDLARPFFSGEFDALSYAFYRSAFETLAQKYPGDEAALSKERKRFAVQVGQLFFTAIHDFLHLELPSTLETPR